MKDFINNIVRDIVGDWNLQTISGKSTYYRRLKRYYSNNSDCPSVKRCCIYMADGKIIHGGLSDRLRGIVSLYSYCKEHKIPFYINFCHPFNLEDYLQPKVVNWMLSNDEIVYDATQSKALVIKNVRFRRNEYVSKRIGSLINFFQLHIYINVLYDQNNFHSLFEELFMPSSELQRQIDMNKKSVGSEYVSVTFRFQQLLGDFKEGNFPTLSEEDQREYIKRCAKVVENIYNKHNKRVLVTSDSHKFLNEVNEKYDFVYVIQGEIHHMDYTNEEGNLPYMKSFVDLYMLSYSNTIYYYAYGKMYKQSGFAVCASLLGNKPYIDLSSQF